MSEPIPSRSRPGAHWYVVGVVLIIMGPIALALSLWIGARAVAGANWRFTAPGDVVVQITAPGAYSLWWTRATDESASIPTDIRIVLVEPTRGGEYELEPLMGAPERHAGRVRTEVARTTLPHPGPYEVIVTGDFPPGAFEFGPSTGPGVAGGGLVAPRLVSNLGPGLLTLNTLLFGSLSIIGIIAGVVIMVSVWIARDRSGLGTRSPAVHSQD